MTTRQATSIFCLTPRTKTGKHQEASLHPSLRLSGSLAPAYSAATCSIKGARPLQKPFTSEKMSLKMLIKQVSLYVYPPFFAHPIKPILNHFIGTDYATAYAHFAADHTTPMNLAMHLACLALQLAGNFALLEEVSANLLGVSQKYHSWLGGATALVWAGSLAMVPDTHWAVKVASVSCIGLGWKFGPALLRPRWVEMTAAMGVIIALAVETHILKRPPFGPVFFGVSLVHGLLWRTLSSPAWKGCLKKSGHASMAISAAGALLAAAASKGDPVAAVVVLGAFTLWPLALLTDSPAVAFYGLGYLATAAQASAHAMSGEAATLVRLNISSATNSAAAVAAKIAYEWGHVVYFPNLLLQATAQALGFLSPQPK